MPRRARAATGRSTTRRRRSRSRSEIGYPVLIKAAAGGGGRGMRVAHNDISLVQRPRRRRRPRPRPRSRTRASTSRSTSRRPRHVEVQILGDQHGNVVHLCERDCSLQRRHQKLVEESPAPRSRPKLRKRDGRARPCGSRKAAGYYNAGTVRVPRRQGQELLLHRGERPHPGRAPGHRAGHRHRPDQGADPHRRRRAAALQAGRHRVSAATRSSAASTPRTPTATSRRRPGTIEALRVARRARRAARHATSTPATASRRTTTA